MSSNTPPVLLYEKRNRIAYISLNRPEVMNALSVRLVGALYDAIADADQDDDILVLILTGEGGRAFSAGADLKEAAQLDAAGGQFTALRDRDTLATCVKPVVAAIDGHCLAGGLEIALQCDIRIATDQSTFGLP